MGINLAEGEIIRIWVCGPVDNKEAIFRANSNDVKISKEQKLDDGDAHPIQVSSKNEPLIGGDDFGEGRKRKCTADSYAKYAIKHPFSKSPMLLYKYVDPIFQNGDCYFSGTKSVIGSKPSNCVPKTSMLSEMMRVFRQNWKYVI